MLTKTMNLQLSLHRMQTSRLFNFQNMQPRPIRSMSSLVKLKQQLSRLRKLMLILKNRSLTPRPAKSLNWSKLSKLSSPRLAKQSQEHPLKWVLMRQLPIKYLRKRRSNQAPNAGLLRKWIVLAMRCTSISRPSLLRQAAPSRLAVPLSRNIVASRFSEREKIANTYQ